MSHKSDAQLKLEKMETELKDSLSKRILDFKKRIEAISEREMRKSLIPVHEHKAGSYVGSGVEDVPYSKTNPKGVNKAEKCMKCGHMHEPMAKCGETVTEKTELIDAKGNKKSVGVKTPFPVKENGKGSKKVAGDKGGVVLPGAKLKKALTAGVPSGVPSTKVNETQKAEPPMAKPPSGVNMSTHVPTSKPGVKKEELEKGVMADIAQRESQQMGAPKQSQPNVKLPGHTQQAQRAANFTSALGGAFQPKGPVSSGLELDKPKNIAKPAPGLASPKAAGVAPKPPGIFGKLLGMKKP